MRRIVLALVVLLVLLGAGAYLLGRKEAREIRTVTSVAEALAGSDTSGYARAIRVRDFTFPEDHGPHPAYKTEWWYFTGNLDTPSGRHFGYQFTIFRIALTPPDSTGSDSTAADSTGSDWRTNQLYMAHFALTDVQAGEMYTFERFSRGAAGLAGAQTVPFKVWLEDWQIRSAEGVGVFPMRLQAEAEGTAVELTLRWTKPLVLQGDSGLSQKGPGRGNASYYYSYTRLKTVGNVMASRDTFAVRGLSWMDREWSTSALGPEQEGWDWFALQLSNGYDLMYYRMRNESGASSRFSEGVLVGPQDRTEEITRDEMILDVLDRWESPRGGIYPSKWRLRVPSEGLRLTVTPYVANQEWTGTVRYWEGAVRVEGTFGGRPVDGSGYVELTGYASQGKREKGGGKRVSP